MSFNAVDWTIIGPALAAGAVVLATHVPLGQQVLRRGIIFIDLAVAQMAGLGVIAASGAGLDPHGAGAQAAAFAAALLGGLLLSFTERRFGEAQEAIIGISFVLAATGGMLLLANNPHGGEELRDLLVGQILWVDGRQLAAAGAVSAVVVLVWRVVMNRLGRPGFYLLFAVSVTVSVQLVGIYLVFASLIVPALATRSLSTRSVPISYGLGLFGYLLGLVASTVFDLPTGAIIVWTLAATALAVSALVGRRVRSVVIPASEATS
jgi:zinc/manganese transport system permease protein